MEGCGELVHENEFGGTFERGQLLGLRLTR